MRLINGENLQQRLLFLQKAIWTIPYSCVGFVHFGLINIHKRARKESIKFIVALALIPSFQIFKFFFKKLHLVQSSLIVCLDRDCVFLQNNKFLDKLGKFRVDSSVFVDIQDSMNNLKSFADRLKSRIDADYIHLN